MTKPDRFPAPTRERNSYSGVGSRYFNPDVETEVIVVCPTEEALIEYLVASGADLCPDTTKFMRLELRRAKP